MRVMDVARLAAGAVTAHRSRSLLTSLGIAVGIAAVVLLTSIGEGVNRFVLQEFTQFGTNIIAVTPGKTETFGMSGAQISNVRPLSLDDATALGRLEQVVAAMPVVQGNAQVEFEGRTRRTMILGVGSELPRVWSMNVSAGRFLPPDDQRAPRGFVVLGATVRSELFGDRNPLGQRLRVGGDRYRVIGVMESKGHFLGFDLDDTVYVPAGKALELFNRESLMEIDLVYRAGSSTDTVRASIERLLRARHGSEDFTVTTQQQMLDVLGSVLDVLTFAVAALGGISLFVGGVGILTIMTIAVRERRAEIGLLRAIGARRSQVLGLFLLESLLLSAIGGLVGLAMGLGIAVALKIIVPSLPVHLSIEYAFLAELLAVAIGLAAGVLPARHAARLQPLDALRAE
ncbi:MAG: ABC transporter permease [Gammaproteobacteria bacterium]|nr:MAG: ABC transporter permease [Gammaproteobacteria bacterium]